MTQPIFWASVALIVITTTSAYASGCRAHTGPVMSCAAGTIYDQESRSCVPVTG